MKKKIWIVLLLVLMSTVLFASNELRVVYVNGAFSTDGAQSNSEESIKLYANLGYNVVIESLEIDGTSWDTTNPADWKMSPADRQAKIEYVRKMKALCDKYGLNYSPYYAKWGWGKTESLMFPRAQASIYREVNFYPSLINKDIFDEIENNNLFTPDQSWGYGFNGRRFKWNNHNDVTLTLEGKNHLQAVSLNTTTGNLQGIKQMQIYNFSTKVELPTNLRVGDSISMHIFRETVDKPKWQVIPLGHKVSYNPNHKWISTAYQKYTVERINSDGSYQLRVGEGTKPSLNNIKTFTASLPAWIEDEMPTGTGFEYNNKVRWEMIFSTGGQERDWWGSSVKFSDFSITMMNPEDQLAYEEWDFSAYKPYYPEEQYVQTRRLYLGLGHTKIKGHFKSLSEGVGGEMIRFPLDPLSPARDLITREMLRIIKEGFEGSQPTVYFLCADEVFVYRRTALSKKGLNNTKYNSMTNGEFFSAMLEKDIKRYESVFGSKNKPKFLFFADTLLPSHEAYKFYAEKNGDTSGYAYIKNNISPHYDIIPVIWIYDYSINEYYTETGIRYYKHALKDPQFLQSVLDPIISHGLSYMPVYATDGKVKTGNMRIDTTDPSINTDNKHIRHEIDLARNWCDIVQKPRNESNHAGYIYVGWMSRRRANGWNGLYHLSYFGWMNKNARDVPTYLQVIYAVTYGNNIYDYNGQPVLNAQALNLEMSTTVFKENFDSGWGSWSYYVNSAASSSAYIMDDGTGTNNVFQVYVGDDGTLSWHIHLKKSGITLKQGKTYMIKFKAKTETDNSRKINVMLEQNGGAWTNYSKAPYFTINDNNQTYSHLFTMTDPTDTDALLIFEMGDLDPSRETPLDITLDDIELIEFD